MKKVFLAGHNGMVGSAIQKYIEEEKIDFELITRSRAELDLTDTKNVNSLFHQEKPEIVIIAAAKVGGIVANSTQPADFLHQNIMIQSNLLKSSLNYEVERLIFLGSSCIYPRMCKQPIKEEYLLSGYLEETNASYAIAKISGLKMCEAFNQQFDTDYRSLMPSNLYGPNDNFDDVNSHVIPGLVSRMHNAKVNNDSKVIVWGSGSPMREFLFVNDLADIVLKILDLDKEEYFSTIPKGTSHINVGFGKDISISELSELIREVVEFKGEIIFDKSMPDGTPKKLLDISRLNNLHISASTNLINGLKQTYDAYKKSLQYK